MKDSSAETIQKQLEIKAQRRARKKKTRMVISGKSVLGLQRIIKKRATKVDRQLIL